ncbi:hypothetical protein CGRA01v4_07227 [Colletotrichum graminicola]|nr:hypothetical protein CGRA01v4_07227 [Colletotrichum graminicola]
MGTDSQTASPQSKITDRSFIVFGTSQFLSPPVRGGGGGARLPRSRLGIQEPNGVQRQTPAAGESATELTANGDNEVDYVSHIPMSAWQSACVDGRRTGSCRAAQTSLAITAFSRSISAHSTPDSSLRCAYRLASKSLGALGCTSPSTRKPS